MAAPPENDAAEEPQPTPPDVTIVANDIGPVGGMERQLTDLLLGLRALGHRVRVIARTCDVPPRAGVDFVRVRGPRRPFVIAHIWFLIAGTISLRRHRRGLVQANGAIVLSRVDIVAVHYCHQVGPAQASRSTPLYRLHVRAASVLKRWSEPLCYRLNRPRRFVCVSEGVAEEMRTHMPWLADRVMTIHNGVDVERFAPPTDPGTVRAGRAELGLGEDALALVFVGAEWERKGLQEAILALAAAPAWTLLVVGSGDQPRYRELARSSGVEQRVRWLGVRADVERVYALADAFVLASAYETFSLVTFEAAASGLPVLATPVSGVRELVREGVNGFLLERDPELIAERLRRLAGDPELRARMGSAARESALAYSSGRMAGRYCELYRALAPEGAGAVRRDAVKA